MWYGREKHWTNFVKCLRFNTIKPHRWLKIFKKKKRRHYTKKTQSRIKNKTTINRQTKAFVTKCSFFFLYNISGRSNILNLPNLTFFFVVFEEILFYSKICEKRKTNTHQGFCALYHLTNHMFDRVFSQHQLKAKLMLFFYLILFYFMFEKKKKKK